MAKTGSEKLNKLKNGFLRAKRNKTFKMVIAVVFWAAVWQIAAMAVGKAVFLPSPVSVIQSLGKLWVTGGFWLSLWNSFYRIVSGFIAAALAAVILAALSYKSGTVRTLLSPLMSVLKAVPVVSFIILLFFLMRDRNLLSSIIPLIMVLPVMYSSVLAGLDNTDKQLLEMAGVYRVTGRNRALYIYGSNVMPFFTAGCKAGLGLAWKSGVAAEVIGTLNDTIGGKMFTAQSYLHTSELLAWTAAIVALSAGFEKLFLFILNRVKKKIET